MKKILLIILLLCNILIGYSQKTVLGSHTIIGSKEKLITSYISFDGQFFGIDKNFNFKNINSYGGVTIASTFDQTFSIGIIGAWRFNSNDIDKDTIIGYFGILLEPTLFGKLPIHLTFPCSFSVGVQNENTDKYRLYDKIIFSSGARIELNIVDGVKFSIGPSIRQFKKSSKDDFLNNTSLDFSIKIGKY